MSKTNNKIEQVRALQKYTDKSLQYFVDEAYRVLGNPIILYDLDWKIIAYPKGVITDDPIWNNHVNNGSMEYNRDIYINEGFVDIMTGLDQVVMLRSEKVKYDRLFGKIYLADNSLVAGLSVVASNKPFENDDIMVTEAICKVLSKKICKIPFYQNYAQTQMETYINMLIKGDIKDTLFVGAYIDMIYIGLKNNLYLAIADIAQCDPTYAGLDYYKNLFKQTRPAIKYSIYSNYIVMIMSTDDAIFYPKRIFNRLNKLFEQNGIKVGISSRFENLFKLPIYYSEAVKALHDGLKTGSGQQIFVYNEEVRPST